MKIRIRKHQHSFCKWKMSLYRLLGLTRKCQTQRFRERQQESKVQNNFHTKKL